ncbi:MAG: ABC transporter permease, partial [Candidatus Izemoplasmataceae bacterium]
SVITAGLMLLLILTISILERKREIGLIRAVGGSRKDVRTIFVGETIMIGFIAGIFSILGVLLITVLVNTVFSDTIYTLITEYFENVPKGNLLTIDYKKFIYALIGCIVIAFISGIIPASSASRKQPVDALRNE